MLKIPVTIVLILLIALQTFSKWCLILEFQVNRDAIAKNLCINRKNATAISCYGKCQLSRRLKQENKDNTPERKPDNGTETISSRSFYLTSFNPYRRQTLRQYATPPAARPIDRPSSHFHPPGC